MCVCFFSLAHFPYTNSLLSWTTKVVEMTTPTTQFAPSSRLGLYEPMHQMSMWEEDTFDGNISPDVCIINDKIDYTSDKSAEDSRPSRAISDKVLNFTWLCFYSYETSKFNAGWFLWQTQRRLAQNREAARKSRQRKKVCGMFSSGDCIYIHELLIIEVETLVHVKSWLSEFAFICRFTFNSWKRADWS